MLVLMSSLLSVRRHFGDADYEQLYAALRVHAKKYGAMRSITYITNAALAPNFSVEKQYSELIDKIWALGNLLHCRVDLVYIPVFLNAEHKSSLLKISDRLMKDGYELKTENVSLTHVFCDGGETHWLRRCLMQSADIKQRIRETCVLWSAESAGTIVAGPTTEIAAVKTNLSIGMKNMPFDWMWFFADDVSYSTGHAALNLVDYTVVPHFNAAIQPRAFIERVRQMFPHVQVLPLCDGEMLIDHGFERVRLPAAASSCMKLARTFES